MCDKTVVKTESSEVQHDEQTEEGHDGEEEKASEKSEKKPEEKNEESSEEVKEATSKAKEWMDEPIGETSDAPYECQSPLSEDKLQQLDKLLEQLVAGDKSVTAEIIATCADKKHPVSRYVTEYSRLTMQDQVLFDTAFWFFHWLYWRVVGESSRLASPHRQLVIVLARLEKSVVKRAILFSDLLPIEKRLAKTALRRCPDWFSLLDFSKASVNHMHDVRHGMIRMVDKVEDYVVGTEFDGFSNILAKPKQSMNWAMDSVLRLASSEGFAFLTSLIPFGQIQMFASLALFSLLSLDTARFVGAIVLFYLGMLSLLITSLQIFYELQYARDLKTVLGCLRKLQPSEVQEKKRVGSVSDPEQFLNIEPGPYVAFATSLLAVLIGYGLDRHLVAWVPVSEFTVLSIVMGGCFIYTTLSTSSHLYVKMFFVALVLLLTLSRFFGNFVLFRSVLSLKLAPGSHVALHISLPSLVLAWLMGAALFYTVAVFASSRSRSAGRKALSTLAAYFWLNLAAVFFSDSSPFGIARGMLVAALFPVLAPAMTLGGVCYFLWHVNKQLLVTAVLFLLPFVTAFGSGLLGMQGRTGRFIRIGFVVLLLAAAGPIMSMLFSAPAPPMRLVPWKDYLRVCGPGSGADDTVAAQLRCLPFRGQPMAHVHARVNRILLHHRENSLHTLVKLLPYSVGNWFACIYGDRFEDRCPAAPPPDAPAVPGASPPDPRDLAVCQVLRSSASVQCSLQRYDVIEIEVAATAVDNEQMSLKFTLGDPFLGEVRQLRVGHVINVNGTISNGFGTDVVSMLVKQVTCVDCESFTTLHQAAPVAAGQFSGVGALLRHFFFSPLIA